MTSIDNPFVTNGYISDDYFCSREKEYEKLRYRLGEGRNIAVISNRYMGKTAFLEHSLRKPEISEMYDVYFLDIYTTKSLRELVYLLGKTILQTLRPLGREACKQFVDSLPSVRYELTFCTDPIPYWNIEVGDIESPETTLEEIFLYFSKSKKRTIVVIDEFQQILKYSDNTDLFLRNLIRQYKDITFIAAGSQAHRMGDMFVGKGNPFRGEMILLRLGAIKKEQYVTFVESQYLAAGKRIPVELICSLYDRFEGTTGFIHKTLNVLFSITPRGKTSTKEMAEQAINMILDSYSVIYSELVYQLSEKQKQVMIAICKEGKASVQSSLFINLYSLKSSFNIMGAVRSLYEKDFVMRDGRLFKVCDHFFALWLLRTY